ncbi:glycosyl hydrolases family 38 protein [Stylonychia lemnae]|uniref:Glycosyl hydrolases family 38 protein n=1 Tax=Stylonychia lemnae TaxID=5949 RepID=A0A078ARZ8_STYLE|nr:glycosyl hydrolases family 38 protein [Stylonychia lemnae]|eukprot:CDW83658.1 glycosyl hydrolases family 38 protein [Stylonychia lemnae]
MQIQITKLEYGIGKFKVTQGEKSQRELQINQNLMKNEETQDADQFNSQFQPYQQHQQSSQQIFDKTLIQEASENPLIFEEQETEEQVQQIQSQEQSYQAIGFNDLCKLQIKSVDSKTINFILTDEVADVTVQFGFEFRFYPSYDGQQYKGGIYVFKTSQSDSSYFSEELLSTEIIKGSFQTGVQFTYKAHYRNTISIVTVYLTKDDKGCGDIEFDIKRDGLERNVEATVNWFSDEIQNHGVFYTDSNGFEYVKRIKRNVLEESDIKSTAPANFYPVNTGIFIENKAKKLQMIVMNDRSQAGSGFREGRIELLFNRRVLTNDELGNPEFLNELDENYQPIRTQNKYFVRFTNSRKQAFKAITERTFKTLNPIRMYQASKFFQENVTITQIDKETIIIPRLHSILKQLDIVDYKLIPDTKFETALLWLQQFNIDKQNVKQISRDQVRDILQQLCKIGEIKSQFDYKTSKCDVSPSFEFTKLTGQALSDIEQKKNDYSLYKILTIKIKLI